MTRLAWKWAFATSFTQLSDTPVRISSVFGHPDVRDDTFPDDLHDVCDASRSSAIVTYERLWYHRSGLTQFWKRRRNWWSWSMFFCNLVLIYFVINWAFCPVPDCYLCAWQIYDFLAGTESWSPIYRRRGGLSQGGNSEHGMSGARFHCWWTQHIQRFIYMKLYKSRVKFCGCFLW